MVNIGGLVKFSVIDYPGKVSAVVFTQGCNFSCPFCHNPELVLPEKFAACITEEEVFGFLKKRRGKIEGVVVTGGEPTIQDGIIPFLRQIREMGYFIKLDTNGTNPGILEEVIHCCLVDFIAMDIKAPFEKYHILSGVKVDTDKINESINIILRSGLDYEFRTTFVSSLLSDEDISQIKALLGSDKRYRVQEFVMQEDIVSPEKLRG